jgi:hypothetical protein
MWIRYITATGLAVAACVAAGALPFGQQAAGAADCDDPTRTYYVSTTGSDANPGSSTAPWRTLQFAFGRLDPGETLVVRGGTYRADLVYERGGTAAAPITVKNYPGETPVLEPVSREPLRVRGAAAWTTFKGLTIQRAAIGSNYQNLFVVGGAHDVTFIGNTIRWALAGSGVFVDDTASRINLVGNRVYQNNGANQHQGIYYEGQNGVIGGNLVYGQTNGFGIQVKSGANQVVIAENTTVDNSLSGIAVANTASSVTIANNISAFNGGYGIRGMSDAYSPATGIGTAFNNLLYGNAAGAYANQVAGMITFGAQLPAADPLFVDRPNRNYRLQSTSPAIGKADVAYVYSPDADGAIRPLGGAADLGAYER